MNGLNESNVTCVTCATNATNVTNVTCAKNVTCVTNVTNEFDETRFLSFVQSDSSAIFAGVSHSRLTFPPAIPPPRKNRTGKRKKRVCQNAHFGFTLEGASEWLRCKALRMRAQGVY